MVHSSFSATSGTSKLGLFPASVSAMVDLWPSSRTGFSRDLPRGGGGGGGAHGEVTMHMWQLELSSPWEWRRLDQQDVRAALQGEGQLHRAEQDRFRLQGTIDFFWRILGAGLKLKHFLGRSCVQV